MYILSIVFFHYKRFEVEENEELMNIMCFMGLKKYLDDEFIYF
jgi:muconolactone delta-isomerase